ncbi:MAG: TIGR00730 family Rossman fold protein [Egibacteraceae bacterium]
MTPIGAVCVYAASSEAVSEAHRRVAAELGRAIAMQGWRLVYGGGATGLMGEVARAALAGGGHVTGVIPHLLATDGIVLHSVTELIHTDTMRERKQIMDERSDAFVVLPGGIGTLEELVEIITLKRLGYHSRAIVIVDDAGFWDPLLAMLQRMVTWRFADPSLARLWQVAPDVEATVQALRTYRPPQPHPDGPVLLETTPAPRDE